MGVLFDAKKYCPLQEEDQPDLKTGTIAYDDFWDEQDDRCINGYSPHGMPRITGEHYFYLNMCKISLMPPGQKGKKRKKAGNPFYRAIDRRLSIETEDAKTNQYGLIVGKPRRIGLSWFGAMQIVYEMLFYIGAEVGVCAGKQDKADDFYRKVMYLLAQINPAYRSSILTKNSEELRLGYGYTENKQAIDEGLLSQMFIKTMFADSSAFEGKSLALCVFEEAGLFQSLIASYKATEPCFRDGQDQFGTPLIYGTGGEIEKGSKDYKEMWENHESFNLKKIFISAATHYPGDGVPDKNGETISFFDFRTGETDSEAAKKFIMAERERVGKSKTAIVKHIQSFPLKESEIFLKSKGGVLDINLLNTQLVRMNEGDLPKLVTRGRLKWVDNPRCARLLVKAKNAKEKAKIRLEHDSKVKFIKDKHGTVVKCDNPINQDSMEYKPDIAGIDSYDDEIEQTGKFSYGAMVVYRCFAGPSREYDYPVAILKERGDSSSDDSFYEHALMLAIYYNCEALIEYSKIAILKHWKDVGAQKYLKIRPDLEAVIGPSKAKNEYGQRMTKREKVLVTKLLKTEVKNSVWQIYFREVIMDLINYGDENTDLAMAFGMALIFKLEMFPDISDEIENDEDHYYDDPLMSMTYYNIEEGELIIKNYAGEDVSLNDDIPVFNPRKDLTNEEKRKFQEKRISDKEIFNNRIKEMENLHGESYFDMIVKDFRKN